MQAVDDGNGTAETDESRASDAEGGKELDISLYFANAAATKVVREKRTLTIRGRQEEAAIEALIEGPKGKGHFPTLPKGTRLLGLEAQSGVATVNFSKELVEGQSGGSAGEVMTVASVVTTLAQFPGIGKVWFLVEGKRVETLAGHLDLAQPVGPDPAWVGEE